MPSKPPSLREDQKLDAESASLEYHRLLAFLELASGFNLALAICNLPALREQLIRDIRDDAGRFGVKVAEVKLSADSFRDFANAVQNGLGELANEKHLAVMIVGVDELIYQPGDENALIAGRRPGPVARLNLDRERIASDLPLPLVLWVERETATVLLSKAPDLSQWISARFDFAGLEPPFAQLVESDQRAMGQPAERTEADITEFRGLLDQLARLPQTDDPVALRTRLAVLNTLGDRYMRVSDFGQARKAWLEALDVATRLGQRRSQAAPLANLGVASFAQGEYPQAIEYHQQALNIAREIEDRRGEEITLGNLGLAYHALGEFRRAIDYFELALGIARMIGDERGEGNVLGNLGLAFNSLGEYDRAIVHFSQALEVARRIGDRRGELNALGNLGNGSRELGNYRRAIEYYERALEMAREVGDRLREGNALGSLGVTYNALRDYRRAIAYHEQYLKIARDIGDRRGEGNALGNLGNTYQALGEHARAAEYHQQNLRIAREIGDLRGEANALWNLSQALDELGDRRRAIANAEAALRIFEQIESPFAATAKTLLESWRSGRDGDGPFLKR